MERDQALKFMHDLLNRRMLGDRCARLRQMCLTLLQSQFLRTKAHLATLSNMHTQCRRRLVARAEIVVQILPQDFERIVIGRQAGLFTAQNQAGRAQFDQFALIRQLTRVGFQSELVHDGLPLFTQCG